MLIALRIAIARKQYHFWDWLHHWHRLRASIHNDAAGRANDRACRAFAEICILRLDQ